MSLVWINSFWKVLAPQGLWGLYYCCIVTKAKGKKANVDSKKLKKYVIVFWNKDIWIMLHPKFICLFCVHHLFAFFFFSKYRFSFCFFLMWPHHHHHHFFLFFKIFYFDELFLLVNRLSNKSADIMSTVSMKDPCSR